MNTEELIDKLASKLGDDDLAILAHVMDKVAYNAAESAVTNIVTKEEQLDKLAHDLAASGFTAEEVHAELQKVAEERAVQDECEKIAQDCMAMGTIIGNTASDTFLNNIRGYIDKHAMPEEDEKEEEASEEAKEEASEEEEGEEKEASDRRVALRKALLQAASL